MKKKGVIVSGYFNPIHKGHLEYFNNAKVLADELFVIVNNDHQRDLKGSKEFQKEDERMILSYRILNPLTTLFFQWMKTELFVLRLKKLPINMAKTMI